ncbi:MAG: hypothetical protein AVDCRST_MAG68-99, partial [uncultured Gemmatimonadetes bacterium]
DPARADRGLPPGAGGDAAPAGPRAERRGGRDLRDGGRAAGLHRAPRRRPPPAARADPGAAGGGDRAVDRVAGGAVPV